MALGLYDPKLGRVLQVDPVEGGSANDYDYCAGDPVNCFDLDGTDAQSDFLKAYATMSKADQRKVLAYGATQQKKQAAINAYVTNDRRGIADPPDRVVPTVKYVAPVVGFFVKVVRALASGSTRPIIPPIPGDLIEKNRCQYHPGATGCPRLLA